MEKRIPFRNREEFREWLKQNHNKSDGFWLVYSKVKGEQTIRYEESLEEALCFGWIDNIIKSIDERTYMRRFTPRRKNSIWSEKNKGIAQRLIKEGRMTEWGFKAIEEGKRAGKWDSSNHFELTDAKIKEFEAFIQPFEKAYQNYLGMSLSHRKQYFIYYFEAKKEETRASRLRKIVEMLEMNRGFM
jgi:uncharacterized protein YdeI (YjbR/CyaY-like superfamily)